MEFLLAMTFVACFMFGAIQVLAFLVGAFAITATWLVVLLFCLIGIVIPLFIFSVMFTSYPTLTAIIVIFLAIWLIIFIIKKGFQGIKICITEIKRYLDNRKYKDYK